MCGIAGLVSTLSPEAARTVVERLCAAQRHRGPDDQGLWQAPGVVLGHRRLSIIDLSPAGHQPMVRGRHAITYNGEIYNFERLGRELGEPLRSHSDTEVLLAGLCRSGAAFVERLTGMFAFGWWDDERRRLLLVRDRLGIKPLLYRPLPDGIAFASEIEPLVDLSPHYPRPALDPRALRDYFTYKYVPAPRTIYRGKYKLPPAHLLWWSEGRIETRRYWQPESSEEIHDPVQAAAQFDELLVRVVREHTLADVPVGVFLSGGVDSTAVTAALERPRTFTLGFDVASHDESGIAAAVAAHLGTRHTGEQASGEGLDQALAASARFWGEPFGDHGAWATYLVSRLARRSVTVALSGEGGDELFGGYHWYRKWLTPSRWFDRVHAVLPTFSAGARTAERRWRTGLERYALFLGPFTPAQRRALLAPALTDAADDELWHFRAAWREDLPWVKRLQWADLHGYLADDMLPKLDRASMAVSLEARPPLLDHRLVELALRFASSLLCDRRHGKLPLRRFLAGRVPANTFDRPKIGFSMPVRRWVLAQPALLERALDRLAAADVLDSDFRRRAPPPRAFTNEQLWCLLVLAAFLEHSRAGL